MHKKTAEPRRFSAATNPPRGARGGRNGEGTNSADREDGGANNRANGVCVNLGGGQSRRKRPAGRQQAPTLSRDVRHETIPQGGVGGEYGRR